MALSAKKEWTTITFSATPGKVTLSLNSAALPRPAATSAGRRPSHRAPLWRPLRPGRGGRHGAPGPASAGVLGAASPAGRRWSGAAVGPSEPERRATVDEPGWREAPPRRSPTLWWWWWAASRPAEPQHSAWGRLWWAETICSVKVLNYPPGCVRTPVQYRTVLYCRVQ